MRTEGEEGLEIFQPLWGFYERSGATMPAVDVIRGSDMPAEYRELLVHHSDMTPVLEKHHGRAIVLNVLDSRSDDSSISREVVLVTEDTRAAVEFGAIRIELDPFPPAAREQILACHRPLGAILGDLDLGHTSAPSAYFRVESDSVMRSAFGLDADADLYGRCNRLTSGDGRLLARVVEILPPGP